MLKKIAAFLIAVAYFYHGYGVYGLERRPLPKNTITDFLAIESGGYSGQPINQPKVSAQGSSLTTKAPASATQNPTASSEKVETSAAKSSLPITKPTSASVINMGTSKVKGLVNFYDNQGKQTGHSSRPGSINTDAHAGQKPLSYSSIVSGNKGFNNKLPDSTRSPSSPVLRSNGESVRHEYMNVNLDKTHKNSNGPASSNPISYSSAVSGGGTKGSPTADKKPAAIWISGNTGHNLGKTVTTNRPISYSGALSGNGKSTSQIPISESSKNPSTPTKIGSTKAPVKTPVDASSISDSELKELSEEFLRKDTNNAAKLINPNYQGKTTSGSKNDAALLPLITVQESVWQIPTIQTFIPLLDNYEKDTLVNEYVTPQEKAEENAFMDSIMSTAIMRRLMNFLKEKGIVSPDPKQQRDFIKQMWFNMYSRGQGKIGSSAFEHIFVSEVKNGQVSGLHNWIYFYREEAANQANYLGHMNILDLNDKGAIIKFHFNLQGIDKPVDTMFVGTSPELEMALYTLCFVARVDRSCPLTLAGKQLNIKTYNFRYRSKNMIGSAYPEI